MSLYFVRGLPRPSRLAGLVASLLVIAGCHDSPSEPDPKTGSLSVTITGLPAGAPSAVSVVGPAGSNYVRQLSGSETLNDLPTGTYTIQAPPVGLSANVYIATPETQQVVVTDADTATATIPYVITTGSMDVVINGLPAGSTAAMLITGPQGFSRTVATTTLITGLVPGVYSVSSDAVTASDGNVYSATPLAQTVAVSASETPKRVSSNYALITGGLDVTFSGLPFGTSPPISVFGPGGYHTEVTGASSLTGLFPGSYTVAGASVTAPNGTYVPTVPSSSVLVTASLTHAQATVTYVLQSAPPPVTFNLLIDAMYVTQAVQTYAGSVPLVAGRPGLLRVFVKSTTQNTAAPTVRVQFYDGQVLAGMLTLDPSLASVPTVISEASLTFSWNAIVDANLMKPGLRILAEVDADHQYAESDETDNAYPPNGVPLAPIVQQTAPINITFVPVQQMPSGLTGNVTNANQSTFLTFAQKILPIRDFNSTVHATFVSSGPELTSDGVGWTQLLLEINALRTAEGSQSHYMGIVNVPYTSGTAGFGLLRGFATVSWDKMPSAAPIAAHELGHNFGRFHAPCGGPASPDPNFPYPNGVIGVHGYDVQANVLMPPTTSDIMGYCGFGWISDYTYNGILAYRTLISGGAVMPDVSSARLSAGRAVWPSMVIWGQIVDGKPSLEPAFMADTRASLPLRPGPNRIEALDASGRTVFSYPFEGEEVPDAAGHSVRQFAYAIPVDSSAAASIATIRLIAANGSRSEWSAAASSAPGEVQATIGRPGEVVFRMTGPSARLAVVRERASGQIVAFVRGSPVVVRTPATDFDVQVSDGVRTSRHAIRPR